jgi:chitinase
MVKNLLFVSVGYAILSSSIFSANWQSSNVYLAGDKAEYNQIQYKAKWWTQGDKPGQSNVWELVTSSSNPSSGNNSNNQSSEQAQSWVDSGVYTGGSQVNYQGNLYQAKWWTQGNQPDLGGPWALLGDYLGTNEDEVESNQQQETENTDTDPVNTGEESNPTVVENTGNWDSTKNYLAGDIVTINGKQYQAKWYANAGLDPEDGVENPWDTPWEYIGQADDVKDEESTNDQVSESLINLSLVVSGLPEGSETSVTFTEINNANNQHQFNIVNGNNAISIPSNLYQISAMSMDNRYTLSPLDQSYTYDVENGDLISLNFNENTVVSDLAQLLSYQMFQEMFPNMTNASCSIKVGGTQKFYNDLILAAKAFPDFANPNAIPDHLNGQSLSYSDKVIIAKKELVAFLANISHETTGGWSTAPGGPQAWGACFIEEQGCQSGSCTQYTANNTVSAPGQTYQGRGFIQLSWNYNYLKFQQYYNQNLKGSNNDIDLINNPSQVSENALLAWESSLWFWMTPQYTKPSSHAVMTGEWVPTSQDIAIGRTSGFGMTVNIINGGIECSKPTNAKVEDRVKFYQRHGAIIGLSEIQLGENRYCDNMQHY